MQRFANVSLKFLDHCEAAKGHSTHRSRTAPVGIREAFCKRLFEPFSSLGIIWTAP